MSHIGQGHRQLSVSPSPGLELGAGVVEAIGSASGEIEVLRAFNQVVKPQHIFHMRHIHTSNLATHSPDLAQLDGLQLLDGLHIGNDTPRGREEGRKTGGLGRGTVEAHASFGEVVGGRLGCGGEVGRRAGGAWDSGGSQRGWAGYPAASDVTA